MISIDSDLLSHYLDIFETIRSRVGENDAAAVLTELAKSSRLKAMLGQRQAVPSANGIDAATEKQLGYLKRLGVNVDRQLSRKEASDLIDQAQSVSQRIP